MQGIVAILALASALATPPAGEQTPAAPAREFLEETVAASVGLSREQLREVLACYAEQTAPQGADAAELSALAELVAPPKWHTPSLKRGHFLFRLPAGPAVESKEP